MSRLIGDRKTVLPEGESLRRHIQRVGQVERRACLGEPEARTHHCNKNRYGPAGLHTRIVSLRARFLENWTFSFGHWHSGAGFRGPIVRLHTTTDIGYRDNLHTPQVTVV